MENGISLDYVSPLPPVRTGIADYSTDLLPHLESRCDLRVIRLPGQPVSEWVEDRWHPVSSEHLGERGRTPLYHMGNNQHHAWVERLAMQHPGVLVLHDLVLHHFLAGRTVGIDLHDEYRHKLGLEHGWMGEAVAGVGRWGAWGDSAQFSLPANRRLARRSRGLLVHSNWAREMLLEDQPDLAVREIPMGIPLPDRVDPALGHEFRRRRGIPREAPLLGSFGFQTPIKRPDIAIRAMASPALASVHLVIAGELSPVLDLEEVIAEAGVGDRVHVTGFLEYEEFEAAISACDLCLNLRYPSAGETSAALLRVLALGRPTVVSEYAQFAELPENVAVKVPVGEGEVEAVLAEISKLLATPGTLLRMGEAARRYVRKQHDPGRAAAAMVAACTELAELEPPGGRVVEGSPTTMTFSHVAGEIEVSGHEAPWAEGEARRIRARLTNLGSAKWLAGSHGSGGVSIEVLFLGERDVHLEEPPWVPLPLDLESGQSHEIEFEVRRPLGDDVRLYLEPHILGRLPFRLMGGPNWESVI